MRAFDARTGKLAWAYDIGNLSLTGEPAEGQTYTRGTPNVWAAPAVDEKLGLIYLPTGNSTRDFWGAERTPAEESHSSAVIALDFRTGRERWVFQTTHHDLWDYDVPAQPTLYDVPDGRGGTLPALIQVTKRDQIFMLDRRSGKTLGRIGEIDLRDPQSETGNVTETIKERQHECCGGRRRTPVADFARKRPAAPGSATR